MDRAREKGSTGNSDVYLASSPEPRKGGMVCAFRGCVGVHEVDVHFVERRGIEGDRYVQYAHYATNPGQREKHHPQCTLVSDFDDASGRSIALRRAVLDGKIILVNLNLDPDAPKFKKPRGRAYESEYDRWRDTHTGKYHSVSVRNEEDYQHVINTIHKHGGDAAVAATMIGYRGRIRPQPEFDISEDKMINVLNTLIVGKNVMSKKADSRNPNTVYVEGFPIRVKLQPGENTQATAQGKTLVIDARPLFAEHDNVVVHIAPRLSLCCGALDNALADKILHGTTTSAIVFPSQIQDVLIKFRDKFKAAAVGASEDQKGEIKTSLRLAVFRPSQLTIIGTNEKPKEDAKPIEEIIQPIVVSAAAAENANPAAIYGDLPLFAAAEKAANDTPLVQITAPISEHPHSLTPQGVEELLLTPTPNEEDIAKVTKASKGPKAPSKKAAGHDVASDGQPTLFDFDKPEPGQ